MNDKKKNVIASYKVTRLRNLIKKLSDLDFAILYLLIEKERTNREIDTQINEIKDIWETIA